MSDDQVIQLRLVLKLIGSFVIKFSSCKATDQDFVCRQLWFCFVLLCNIAIVPTCIKEVECVVTINLCNAPHDAELSSVHDVSSPTQHFHCSPRNDENPTWD